MTKAVRERVKLEVEEREVERDDKHRHPVNPEAAFRQLVTHQW